MFETKADISVEERAQIFHESYSNDLDAGTTLADLVIAAGNFLTRIIGADAVDAGMARIIELVVTTSGPPWTARATGAKRSTKPTAAAFPNGRSVPGCTT